MENLAIQMSPEGERPSKVFFVLGPQICMYTHVCTHVHTTHIQTRLCEDTHSYTRRHTNSVHREHTHTLYSNLPFLSLPFPFPTLVIKSS